MRTAALMMGIAWASLSATAVGQAPEATHDATHEADPTMVATPGRPVPEASVPGEPTAPDSPSPYAVPPEEPAQEDPSVWVLRPDPGHDFLRVLAELGLGSLGAGLGGGIGLLGLWISEEADGGPQGRLITGALITVLGGLGIAAGVILGAAELQGEGRAGDAAFGELLGALVALPVIAYAIQQDLLGPALAAGWVLPLAGAVLAYEISHAGRQLGAPQASRPRFLVTPLAQGGAYAAYGDRFP